MIVPAHGRWPRRHDPVAVPDSPPNQQIDEVFDLLDRVIALTQQSATRFDAGAADDGLDLLDQRAPLFLRMGEIFGLLATGSALDGGARKGVSGPDLDRLTFAAGELGRLDTSVSAKLESLRGDVGRDLENLRPDAGTAPGYIEPELPRHLDRRG